MERQMCRLLLTVLLLLVLNSALAQNKHSYSEVGGTLVLTPPFSGHINQILWKHGGNLVAEWYIGELDYYGMFRGRTTLDTTTGGLEIKDMTESYAGLYTVEINNRPQSQGYNVEVIKRLSKPEVVQRPLSCSTASGSCTLSCDGDTSGAGSVTYSWKEDDGEWVLEGKDKTIMNNEETQRIKTFSCQMKNPVSVEESDPHQNPFFQVPGSVPTEHNHIYAEVGGTLVLTPPFSGHINQILWKHGGNLAAEWYIGELDYYGMFRGRTTLDTTTGGLEIKDMTESYAGLYTVEINNRPQSQGYNVEVIRRVSKPEVVQRPLSCSTASDSCTLSCGNGDTSGAGPVTYSWKKDDGEWVLEGKDKTIMNNEETQRIKTFSCQMKNPVSVEESDPHQNPFFQVPGSVPTEHNHIYAEVGGTLVLTPPFSGHINQILWKHGGNLAAEWYIGELDYYGMFRGRTTLDTTTGGLEIKDMTESYAGLYTVEINNKVQSQGYDVEVIRRVPKPEVVQRPLSCSTASDSCTLSCDGDTSGAGSVTYSWKEDDREWVQEEKDKTIMNNEETQRIKTFSCQMKNPVSVEESDPHQNPFFQEESLGP